MIVGFANMIARAWEDEEPRTVFVGFDTVGVPTYRSELLPEYQSGRDFPPVLTSQLDRLPELVGTLGFAWAKADGYEADDFLGAAVEAEEAKGGRALVPARAAHVVGLDGRDAEDHRETRHEQDEGAHGDQGDVQDLLRVGPLEAPAPRHRPDR